MMENYGFVRKDIQQLADQVQDLKTLQIVRNILEMELLEESEITFPQELKDELDKRKVSHASGHSLSYTVEEVEEFARNRKK